MASHRVKSLLKDALARVARPAIHPLESRLAEIEARLTTTADQSRQKYDSELAFWRWLVKEGGAQKDYGQSFNDLFGGWMRMRIVDLARFLKLSHEPSDAPDGVDAWCAARSVVEIGAGPYPAVAAARQGWKRAVVVDPIARGYCEEDMLPPEAAGVVYIQAPGEDIPLANRFADLVINENCLDHVSNPGAVVAEMIRILKPGGLLWFSVDLSNYSDHMHPHPMSEARVRALFSDLELVQDELTANKSHPEAYGAYRGLWRKPGGSPAIPPVSVVARANGQTADHAVQ